jgi:hypothetical protein
VIKCFYREYMHRVETKKYATWCEMANTVCVESKGEKCVIRGTGKRKPVRVKGGGE